MVRSLLILALVLSGSGSGCCGGIWHIGPWRFLGLVGSWCWLVMVPLDMGLFIFWLIVLLLWGFGGALMAFAGVGLVYLD